MTYIPSADAVDSLAAAETEDAVAADELEAATSLAAIAGRLTATAAAAELDDVAAVAEFDEVAAVVVVVFGVHQPNQEDRLAVAGAAPLEDIDNLLQASKLCLVHCANFIHSQKSR